MGYEPVLTANKGGGETEAPKVCTAIVTRLRHDVGVTSKISLAWVYLAGICLLYVFAWTRFFNKPSQFDSVINSSVFVGIGMVAFVVAALTILVGKFKPGVPTLLMLLITSLNLTVLGFSVLYYNYSHKGGAECLSEPDISPLDAVYFTVTTMTTTGYGDIKPESPMCRGIATAQMGFDLILFGGVVTIAVDQLSSRREQKRQT